MSADPLKPHHKRDPGIGEMAIYRLSLLREDRMMRED
jgi:hypothetical protein